MHPDENILDGVLVNDQSNVALRVWIVDLVFETLFPAVEINQRRNSQELGLDSEHTSHWWAGSYDLLARDNMQADFSSLVHVPGRLRLTEFTGINRGAVK